MSGYEKQLTISDSFLQLKVKNLAYARIFKDNNSNSRTFQGLEFFIANSRTFQDFQGPWQPCKSVV